MRWAEGRPVHLPFDVMVHLVAVRYGCAPAEVESWPADHFGRAAALLAYTGGLR